MNRGVVSCYSGCETARLQRRGWTELRLVANCKVSMNRLSVKRLILLDFLTLPG